MFSVSGPNFSEVCIILCYDLSTPAIHISHTQVKWNIHCNFRFEGSFAYSLYVNEKVIEFSTAISDKNKEIVKKLGKSLQQLRRPCFPGALVKELHQG